jgi:SAM-dependent methyltransferase
MNFSGIAQVQKRLFAWGMAKANGANTQAIKLRGCPDQDNLAGLKRSLLGKLQGRILEIGPGAGANLGYYPPDITWIGVEPNPFMHSYLREEAAQRQMQSIELYQTTAEHLPVADGSMDAVVSTHVLCSVTQLENVLQEIQRVLKPGGTFIFLEHVAAKDGTCVRTVQDGVAPFWKALFDNCHPNREIGQALTVAGFDTLHYEPFELSFPIVSPHIAGVATKGSA